MRTSVIERESEINIKQKENFGKKSRASQGKNAHTMGYKKLNMGPSKFSEGGATDGGATPGGATPD